MTIPIASASNLYSGYTQQGLVTNTYGGFLTSGGNPYTMTLPFRADKFEWTNYTKFATTAAVAQGVWYRGYPAANSSDLVVGTSPALNVAKEAINGVTIADTASGFVDEHRVITGIAAGVVTVSAAHGYVTGQRVIITKVIGTVANQVNNKTFIITVLTATTFQLNDLFSIPIVQVGTYSSSGQSTLTGPNLGIVNAPVIYKLLLGSAVMGVSGDVIYFTATRFNAYQNIGTTP